MYFYKKNGLKAAGYYRLSREDGDKSESDSIINQKELIRDYVSKHEKIRLVDEYADDGFSGTNYDRPAFKRLIQDVKKEKIDCIIVKDLSRLGRNYIETGKYLERIFPMLGVRFISVNDYYDSFSEDEDTEQIVIPFKNLINDAYCRDLSVKIRSQLDIKRKTGKFIGSFAGYGYRKDPRDNNHLIVDEDAAEIVRMIFAMALNGYSANKIAGKLNETNVPTPMEYKILSGEKFISGFHGAEKPRWHAVQILRILKNELYIGTMVQGKAQKVNYKVKQLRPVAEAEWIRVKDTHDPIISEKIFQLVQDMLSRDTRTASKKDCIYLFSGYLRCPDCGQNMVRRIVRKKGKDYCYYHCGTYNTGKGCSSHLISEKKVYSITMSSIQQQISMLIDFKKMSETFQNSKIPRPGLKAIETQIHLLKSEIARYSELLVKLYEDYHEGIVDKQEYMDIHSRFSGKVSQAKIAFESLDKKKKALLESEEKPSDCMEFFYKYKNIQKLDRKTVVSLIDHIDVYDKNHVEIHFRYKDELQAISDWMKDIVSTSISGEVAE